MLNKLYGAAAIFALIGLLWWRYDYVVSDRDAQKLAKETAQSSLKELTATRKKERIQLEEANARETKTLIEKKAIEDEAQANRDCIANRTCGVSVSIKYQACPTVSDPATGIARANELYEQERRNFESWVNDLRQSVRLDNLEIVKLQEDLRVRSDSKYCQPN